MSTAFSDLSAENAARDDRSLAETLILSAENTDDPIRRERRLASAGVYLRHHEFSVLAERRQRLREDAEQIRVMTALRARFHAVGGNRNRADAAQLDAQLLDAWQDWTQSPLTILQALSREVNSDVPDSCESEPEGSLLSWVLDDPATHSLTCLPAIRATVLQERLDFTRWTALREALVRRSLETLGSPDAEAQLVPLAMLAVALLAPELAPALLAARLMQEARNGTNVSEASDLLLASLSRLSRADDDEHLKQIERRQAAAVCAFLICRDCSDRAFALLAPGALAVVSAAEAERLTGLLVRRPGMPGAFFRTVAVAMFTCAHQDEVRRVIDELAAKKEADDFLAAMRRSDAGRLLDGQHGVRLVPMERVQQVLPHKHDGMPIALDVEGEIASQLALNITQDIWQKRDSSLRARPESSFRARLKNVPLAGASA